MARNYNSLDDTASQDVMVPATQDESGTQVESTEDIFLTLQRATSSIGMIYNDVFDKPEADFAASLSDYYTPDELRYARDMITAIVKRKTKKAVGPLTERRSGSNLKENLLRDIYCLYSYGEGAINDLPKNMTKCDLNDLNDLNDLPKNMTKCDPKFSSQGIQTDSCLSDTLFASKSDLDNLKAELLYKKTEIRSKMNALNSVPSLSKSGPLSSNHPQVVQLASIHHSPTDSLPYTPSSPRNLSNNNKNLNPTFGENSNTASDTPTDGYNIQNQHSNKHKTVIAGDSLLHRMSSKRMNVKDIPTVKLTKPGDILAGTVSLCINYISKHNNDLIDVVLMAGTNDLSNRKVSPEDLIKSTDEYITQIKGVSNVGKIFICKIPPRCDFHAVNLKVSEYNSLLVERFDNTEEFLEVIDTIYTYLTGPHPLQVISSRAKPYLLRERATLAAFSWISGVGHSGS